MLKILQARLQQQVNCELPDVQAGLRKDRGTRDQIANIHWIIEKAREFQKTNQTKTKHLFLLYWQHQSLWLYGSQQIGKFFKRWEYQTTLPASWETCMQVKKQQLESDMEQRTGYKLGKERIKAVYCHPAYLTYMQWRSCKMDETQTGFKIGRRNVSNLRYAEDTTLMAESEEELKSLLMRVKEENEKAGLKWNIEKTKIMASGHITSWQIDWETGTDYVLSLQNHWRLWLQPWN